MSVQSKSRNVIAVGLLALGIPALVGAQLSSSKVSIHGYLTQGWGRSSGTAFYGLSDDASTDFRYAALQLRYLPTNNDQFVVQLNHRRLGRSPITDFESDVTLNWAFYQHAFRIGTTIKVGRMPIPRGIYNELRAVGVVLPMYRPPVVFYDEGAYYSETIDGAIASHTFGDASWSLETNLYVGGWRSLAYDTWSPQYSIDPVRAENAVGTQMWLNTPVDGLRLGAAAQRHDDKNENTGDVFKMKEYHVSVDATRERWFLRTEAQLQDYGTDKLYVGYLQLNVKPTERLSLTGEIQRSRDTEVEYGDGLPSSYEWHRSDGVGVSYSFSPSLVLKLEHHWDRGIQVEEPANPMAPPKFRYVMASLSASF